MKLTHIQYRCFLFPQGLSNRPDEPGACAVAYLKTICNYFRFYYHSPDAVMQVMWGGREGSEGAGEERVGKQGTRGRGGDIRWLGRREGMEVRGEEGE